MNDAITYRIANASAALGVPVQITHAWQVGAVACYALAFSPRITVREIKARQDDLARLVGASITISQDETTGMVIAQARAPRRQRLLTGPKRSGLRVAIGRFTSGHGDAVLDFTSPAHILLLLVAAIGGDKTEAIHTILYQIASKSPFAQASLLLIDPAGNRIHEAWDGSDHLAVPVVRADLAAALRALEWAADLVRQRNAERRNSPHLLVVVDEMASLFFARDDAERARNALAAITQLGRVAGVARHPIRQPRNPRQPLHPRQPARSPGRARGLSPGQRHRLRTRRLRCPPPARSRRLLAGRRHRRAPPASRPHPPGTHRCAQARPRPAAGRIPVCAPKTARNTHPTAARG